MTNSQTPIITIDGPSGSGKGTIAQLLAEKFGWHYLDSGALYRVLGLASAQASVDANDEAALADLSAKLNIRFTAPGPKIFLNNQEVTDLVRTEKAGNLASKVSRFAAVREALLACQRDFCQLPGLVTDGRDMGTIVFPSAPLKIFMLASAEERAKRRYQQLKASGIDVKLSDLVQELAERDERDTKRQVAPLIAAEDAITIDTTGLNIDEVMANVLKEVECHFPTL